MNAHLFDISLRRAAALLLLVLALSAPLATAAHALPPMAAGGGNVSIETPQPPGGLLGLILFWLDSLRTAFGADGGSGSDGDRGPSMDGNG